MNWVDWAIIVAIVLSALQAAAQGVFVEIFSLGGVVAGLILGSWEYGRVAPWFLHFVNSKETANLVAFLAIFLGTLLLAGVAGRIARWAVREVGLGFLDRLLGALFGVIRGGAVVSIILMAAAAFAPESKSLAESEYAPFFLLAARTATWVAPREVRERVREGAVAIRGAVMSKAEQHPAEQEAQPEKR
jgi:membrane protein required for colicin V production